MKIEPETPLEITTDGQSLTVTPVGQTERAEKLAKVKKVMHEKYGEAFRKLAK